MNKLLATLGCLIAPSLTSCMTSSDARHVQTNASPVELYSSTDRESVLLSPKTMARLKDVDERLNELNDASDPFAVNLNRAQIALMQNRLDDAETHCRNALALNLKNNKARRVLAQIMFRKGKIDAAEIALTSIGDATQKDAEALNLMALIALQRNEPTKALALFKKALAVAPANVAVRMNLGTLYLTYRQVNAAAIQFERVLKDQPENLDAKFHLAIARTALGKPEFAAQVYEDVLDQKADHPLALFNSALLDADRGDYKQASARLKEYLKTDYAKTSNNKEVFALIEDIERGESAKGMPKSDEEIQKLAAKAVSGKDDAQDLAPQKAEEVAPKKPEAPAAAPAETKKPSAIPQQKAPVNVDADIDMLQKELSK